MTGDLRRRVWQHRQKVVKGFSQKYNITRVVYFESTIAREKRIKGWLRAKKLARIETLNPQWGDLSEDWE